MSMNKEQGLSLSTIEEWQADFQKNSSRLIAQKACTKFDTFALLSDAGQTLSNHFNTKISTEVKPVTNQKSSGRCWIFACLNIMRSHFCKEHKLDEFEFSQSHLFFWDKVERCNYMLGAFIKLAQEGADYTDRTLYHLLSTPTNDGGQWQMLVNLVEKYGVIPHNHWPSPRLAESSKRLALILDNQLRGHCYTLVNMVKDGKTQEELDTARKSMMKSLFNVISICLGSPPDSVKFDFYNKDKKYHSFGPLSPLEFYQQMIKPLFDMEKQLVLTHDPRPTSEYNRTYTVAYLNNMDNCKPVVYLNLPIEELKKYTKKSIENDQAVWFGCDDDKESYSNRGTMDTDQFDYELFMGINIRPMDKATRMLYKESEMTHAMVFTGANIEESGVVSKWRVENSWGESVGGKGKGYYIMTDSWFEEYVTLVVVDRSLVSDDILKSSEQEPIMLPAWDPMGALARN